MGVIVVHVICHSVFYIIQDTEHFHVKFDWFKKYILTIYREFQ